MPSLAFFAFFAGIFSFCLFGKPKNYVFRWCCFPSRKCAPLCLCISVFPPFWCFWRTACAPARENSCTLVFLAVFSGSPLLRSRPRTPPDGFVRPEALCVLVVEAAETVLLGRRENSCDIECSFRAESGRNRVSERTSIHLLQVPLLGRLNGGCLILCVTRCEAKSCAYMCHA